MTARFLRSRTTVGVRSVREAVVFYERVAGFEVVVTMGEPSTIALVGTGEVGLGLVESAPLPVAEFDRCVDADVVEGLYQRCVDASATVTSPLTRQPWGDHHFAIADPDRNQIAFGGEVPAPWPPDERRLRLRCASGPAPPRSRFAGAGGGGRSDVATGHGRRRCLTGRQRGEFRLHHPPRKARPLASAAQQGSSCAATTESSTWAAAGAVLVTVAHLVPNGRVVGVDLWRTVDQSGNREEATARNATLEGVAERVELHTGDMIGMAFDSDSFDVVLSSVAIHNVKPASRRREAVDEAVRVLKPGGRLVVADIQATDEYARRLREVGMADVATRRLGWRGWYGGPWMAISAVTASKPRSARS